MKRLGIVIVVLLALAVGVDRLAAWGAQGVVASSLQKSQDLDQKPDVDITGFPFLTQLAGGTFDEVKVGLDSYRLAGGLITLSDIDLVFHDVSRDGRTVRADTVRGSALISYGTLVSGLGSGARVTYAGDGAVSIEVAGRTVGTVVPMLNDGSLAFARPGSQSAVTGVALPLGGLPFQVTAASLQAQPDGLHLAMQGSDLAYRG